MLKCWLTQARDQHPRHPKLPDPRNESTPEKVEIIIWQTTNGYGSHCMAGSRRYSRWNYLPVSDFNTIEAYVYPESGYVETVSLAAVDMYGEDVDATLS
jgi:hypothetical protein